MEQLVYVLFIFCSLGMFFVFIRGSVIDLETEYVPDNIVIGTYSFAILYAIGSSIITKSLDNIKIAALGFIVAFIIPTIITDIGYWINCLVWKLSNKGKKLPQIEVEELSENPTISRNIFKVAYILGSIGIVVAGLITKNYRILVIGIVSLVAELILGIILRRFYVIKVNYSKEKLKEVEDLELGIGGGDIILFGAIGIMFGVIGFIITLIYSIFAHIIITIIYGFCKKINPLKYPTPFLPGLTVGILIYSCGLEQYIFNLLNLLTSIF